MRERSRRRKIELSECQDCGSTLTDDNWSASNQQYGRYMCKSCWNTRQAKYTEASRSRNPNWRQEKSEKARARRMNMTPGEKEAERLKRLDRKFKKDYGITYNDYELMLSDQNNKCAGCHGETKGRGSLHVDHCHSTGVVRGLLCSNCNLSLGLLYDNTETLQRLIEYLNKERK